MPLPACVQSRLLGKFSVRVYSPSCASQLQTTQCLHIFCYALSFGQYVQLNLCVYTMNDTFHKSLSHTAYCATPAAIQKRKEKMFPLDKDVRQQTLESLLRDCEVNQICDFKDACNRFRLFKDPNVSLWSLSHAPNVFRRYNQA